jgi:hypothetical protein
VSSIVTWHIKNRNNQGCVNVALQGGVCYCHGANTKLCCYDIRLFDELTKEWKIVDTTIMFEREDFVVGMVQTSLYQSAAAVDAPTNAEMETFAMAVV